MIVLDASAYQLGQFGAMNRRTAFAYSGIFIAATAATYLSANGADGFSRCVTLQSAGFVDDLSPSLREQYSSYLDCTKTLLLGDLRLALVIVLLLISLAGTVWSLRAGRNAKLPDMKKPSSLANHSHLAGTTRALTEQPSTYIGKGITFVGDIQAPGTLHIDGTMNGRIACSQLVISEHGNVKGDVIAERVVVLGKFHGTMRVEHATLSLGCEVEGTIEHSALLIEYGAKFIGTVRRAMKAPPLLVRMEPIEITPHLAQVAAQN